MPDPATGSREVADDLGPSMEDILMVRACLSFAAQYQPKGMQAFDRIMDAVDNLANALEDAERYIDESNHIYRD